MKKFIDFITEEFVFCILLVLVIIFSLADYRLIKQYPSWIDWKTISALTGLLIITTGIRESGYLDLFAENILNKLKTERTIAIFLILFSAAISCFVIVNFRTF